MIMKFIIPLITIGASVLSLYPTSAQADEVKVGKHGSYSTTLAKECKPLPERIYRTKEVTGPTVTGQWWSSLLWQEFSSNMFAHPMGMVCSADGLAINYPGIGLTSSNDAIMGSGVSKEGDLRIGMTGSQFASAECGGYSDWFVTAEFMADKGSLKTSYGHGSPFIYGLAKGGTPEITLNGAPRVWSGGEKDAVLGITVRGCHYALFGPKGSTWVKHGESVLVNESNKKGYFSVALLPDDKPETLALFKRYAYSFVTNTTVDYEVLNGKVKATHKFHTTVMEGKEKGTLFALYPHQWKYSDKELTGHVFRSVRGEMKLAEGEGFDTEVVIQGVLPMLPKQGIKDRERMITYLKQEADKAVAPFADTYWEGKYLGRLATLSGIAEMAEAPELQKLFITELKRRLENWFTATPGETDPYFYYNSNWGALVGSKPSYGSDMPLNDHHFHYGYFLRAAAEVARFDPAWAKKWEGMVLLIIRDIASPSRTDKQFPYIRCFDKYAGHSWASGDANFGDGNNQESSSESLNAWYGMMLWGEATGNKKVRDTGIALFNTERTAIEEYWFDVAETNFPKDFPQVALGMVWGGKGAFATWFSGDIDCIHGINWLPFTPASIYMGRHPDYVKKNYDRIVEKREKGKDFNNGWGDLVVMFGALNDPKTAATYLDKNPSCSLEGGNTHAFMYHWIQTLDSVGLNDASVYSDHPFTNVYVKDNKKTYAAYNFGKTPLKVRFSDGKKMVAKPGALSVETR